MAIQDGISFFVDGQDPFNGFLKGELVPGNGLAAVAKEMEMHVHVLTVQISSYAIKLLLLAAGRPRFPWARFTRSELGFKGNHLRLRSTSILVCLASLS